MELINPNLQRGWGIDKKNPGLVNEVNAHEDGHGSQFEEAFKSKLTVKSGFSETKDGKQSAINFSGKIDDILNQADKQFDVVNKANPDILKGTTKETYVTQIFFQALGEILTQMNTGDKEADANKRAAEKLGGKDKMPYTNGVYPIKLN